MSDNSCFSFIIGSGCDRSFCGAYWHALGVTGNGSYPVCSQDTLRPVCIIVHHNC